MKNEQTGKLDLGELAQRLRQKSDKGELKDGADVQAALAGALTGEQTKTLAEVLADRERTRKLLESEQAKALFERFFGEKNG